MSVFDHSVFASSPELDAAIANLPDHPPGFKSREQKLLDAMQALATGHDLTMDDLRSIRKGRRLSRCRQLIAYTLHDIQGFSFPEIGRAMGKHHTTIMYAARRFRARLAEPDAAGEPQTEAGR